VFKLCRLSRRLNLPGGWWPTAALIAALAAIALG